MRFCVWVLSDKEKMFMVNDKVVGKIIKGFSSKSVGMAKNAISDLDEKAPSFKVSYFLTDEDTKKYIEELDLDNPKKLAVFLVEVGFSAVDVVIESIRKIQKDMLKDDLSKLNGIKQKIKHAMLSENSFERLTNYQDELIDLRNKLEGKVAEYIQEIEQIDNMSSFERKLKAAFIRNNIDLYTKSAQLCLQAVMEITKVHIFIADYVGDNYFFTIQSDIDDFMNRHIFSGNKISIMNDWATKEDRNFWSDKIRKEYAQIMEQHKGVLELFEDIRNVAAEQKVDLEDIVFE